MLTRELRRRLQGDMSLYYRNLRGEAAVTPVADLAILLEERELAEVNSYLRGMLDEVRIAFRKQIEASTGDSLLAREIGRRLERDYPAPTIDPMSHERVTRPQTRPPQVGEPEPVSSTANSGVSGKFVLAGVAVAVGATALVLRRPWITLLSLIGAVFIYTAWPAHQPSQQSARKPARPDSPVAPRQDEIMAAVDGLLVDREADIVAQFERVLDDVEALCSRLAADRSASHA